MSDNVPNDFSPAANNFNHIFGAGSLYTAAPPQGQSLAGNTMTFFKSTNGGLAWTVSNVSASAQGNAVAVDPANENVIYVGGQSETSWTSVIFKTVNGGSSWTNITAGLGGWNVQDLAIDPADSNRVYAGTSNSVYRSDNAGGSWTKVTDYPATSIAINRNASAEVYIGGSQGVFFSNNRGATWQDFNTGLSDKDVTCLAFDPANNIIYAGTSGGGVFRNSALRTLVLTCGAGGATSPAAGTYFHAEGTSVQVTATANAKFRFSGWSGDASGTANPLTVVMNSNKSIAANFERTHYTLTTAAGDGGTTLPAPGSTDYTVNASVQVRAIPNANYEFTSWSGDATGTANPLTVVMSADKSIRASFQRLIYAPSDFAGVKRTNRSLFLVEYANRLTWQNNPANTNIVKHKLYLVDAGMTLVAEIPVQTSEYTHRGVDKTKEYSYALTAVNSDGREGLLAFVTVK